MARPKKTRYVTIEPGTRALVPENGRDGSKLEPIELGHDEYEALRLVDYEGLFQDSAGEMLGVSRQTVGRILVDARRKFAGAFVEGRPIRIEGGETEMMDHYVCSDCGHQWLGYRDSQPGKHCPACGKQSITVSEGYTEPSGRGR